MDQKHDNASKLHSADTLQRTLEGDHQTLHIEMAEEEKS